MRHATATATLLLLPFYALAQKPAPTHRTTALNPAVAPAPSRIQDAPLPVTRVSLYKNGVGFFEHTGTVTGNAQVTIDFTNSQLNDVLQSLTAIDLNGGRISGAGYNSTTPLDQQLKNLSLGLGESPSQADFYAAIRGARISVTAPGIAITGRLLSLEERALPTKSTDDPAPSRQFLTVVSDTGDVRTLELTPSTTVRLLDTALHTDVTRYLALLDSNRNQGLRHLTLQDNGTGSRELHLSYLSEVPIWKSTYRILFTDPATKPGAPRLASETWVPTTSSGSSTATLQGWSVVDNTTGTDWINVHLSLIAGAPQSFIQPLSQPIYSRRPEIPIAQEAQLTPQTHDSSIQGKQFDRIDTFAKISPGAVAPPPAPMMAMKSRSLNSVHGYASGSAGMAGMPMSASETVEVSASNASLATYEDAAEASLTPSTTTAAFDDFFAYNLTEPVTILKNQSALVPILQAKITADRVTLVSSNGSSTSQPLRALWITNTSGLTLDRGSFTIVENGNFGGEGLLDPIHPDEKRLLSYAADQAVHVTTEEANSSQRIVSITASKGVLQLHQNNTTSLTYVLHNSAADARTIVLEHPVQPGYKLDSENSTSADTKPTETTATVYRYRLNADPGATVKLHIGAHNTGTTTYGLTNTNDNQLTFILNQTNHNPALVAALQPILDARRRVADAQTAVNQTNQRITALRSDEDRQRSNITALAASEKSSKQRFVDDLNRTEDALKAAQTELATRTSALEAAQSDLANRIESLQIDTTI